MAVIPYKELSDDHGSQIDLPLVIKHATLMSQGIWNNVYYDKDEILKAFNQTDWKSREKRNLFLDHKDTDASEWIGEIQNMSFEGDSLYGDLYVVDSNWAGKLYYGKPKVGISPKVIGDVDEKTKSMSNFTFENFSIVMNPAVKRAFINNMEKLKMEESQKTIKTVINDSTVIPLETKVENKVEEISMDEVAKDLADLFELFESKKLSVTKVMHKAEEIRQKEETLKDALRRAGKILEDEMVELANKPVEETKRSETMAEKIEPVVESSEVLELKRQVVEMTEQIKALKNEPEIRSVKKLDSVKEPKSTDEGMMMFLKEYEDSCVGGDN